MTNLFDQFWQVYPARNGRKLEKGNTLKAFLLIAKKKHALVVQCAKNFAGSKDVKAGFGIKDPKRFLRNDFWREWMVPDKTEHDRSQYNHKINAIPKCNGKVLTPEQKQAKAIYMKKLFELGKVKGISREDRKELKDRIVADYGENV